MKWWEQTNILDDFAALTKQHAEAAVRKYSNVYAQEMQEIKDRQTREGLRKAQYAANLAITSRHNKAYDRLLGMNKQLLKYGASEIPITPDMVQEELRSGNFANEMVQQTVTATAGARQKAAESEAVEWAQWAIKQYGGSWGNLSPMQQANLKTTWLDILQKANTAKETGGDPGFASVINSALNLQGTSQGQEQAEKDLAAQSPRQPFSAAPEDLMPGMQMSIAAGQGGQVMKQQPRQGAGFWEKVGNIVQWLPPNIPAVLIKKYGLSVMEKADLPFMIGVQAETLKEKPGLSQPEKNFLDLYRKEVGEPPTFNKIVAALHPVGTVAQLWKGAALKPSEELKKAYYDSAGVGTTIWQGMTTPLSVALMIAGGFGGATAGEAKLAATAAKGGTRAVVARAGQIALAPMAGYEAVVNAASTRILGGVLSKANQVATRTALRKEAMRTGIKLSSETEAVLIAAYRTSLDQRLNQSLVTWMARHPNIELSDDLQSKIIATLLRKVSPEWSASRMMGAIEQVVGKGAITPQILTLGADRAATEAMSALPAIIDQLATPPLATGVRGIVPAVTTLARATGIAAVGMGSPMPGYVQQNILSQGKTWLQEVPEVRPNFLHTVGIAEGEAFIRTDSYGEPLIVGTFHVREGRLTIDSIVSAKPNTLASAKALIDVGKYIKENKIALPPRSEMSDEAKKIADKIEPPAPAGLTLGQKILKLHNTGGGSTVNPAVGNLVGKPYYSVGMFPDRTVIVKGAKLTQEDLDLFVQANQDLLQNPDYSVGTWLNKPEKQIELDIVATVKDKTQAIAMAEGANQKAIYDLKDGITLYIPPKQTIALSHYSPRPGNVVSPKDMGVSASGEESATLEEWKEYYDKGLLARRSYWYTDAQPVERKFAGLPAKTTTQSLRILDLSNADPELKARFNEAKRVVEQKLQKAMGKDWERFDALGIRSATEIEYATAKYMGYDGSMTQTGVAVFKDIDIAVTPTMPMDTLAQLETDMAKGATPDDIKRRLIAIVQATVPKELQGNFLKTVRVIKTKEGLVKAVARANKMSLDFINQQALTGDEATKSTLAAKIVSLQAQTKNLPLEYRQKAAAILEGFDLKYRTGGTLNKREALRAYMNMLEETDGIAPTISEEMLEMMNSTPLRDMTTGQLQTILDETTTLIHLGMLKNRLIKIQAGRRIDEAVDGLITQLGVIPKAPAVITKASLKEAKLDKSDPFESVINRTYRMERILLQVDGYDENGVFLETFYKPINAARNQELKEVYSYLEEQFRPFLKERGIDLGKILGKKEVIEPGLTLTPAEKIGVYLHSLNNDNLLHLRYGNKLSNEQIAKVVNSLTPEERALAEHMQGYYKAQGAEISKVRTLVEGRGMTVTDNYFPIMIQWGAMPEISFEKTLAREEAQRFAAQWASAGIKKSFLKERSHKAMQPVDLDAVGVFIKHLNQVSHYKAYAPVVRDLQMILNNAKFKQAFILKQGRPRYEVMDKWLKQNAESDALRVTSHADSILRHLRVNSVAAVSGFNLVMGFRQTISWFTGMAEVGELPAIKGLATYLRHPKDTKALIRQYDPQTYKRSFEREIAEEKMMRSLEAKVTDKITWREAFMFLTTTADRLTVSAIWRGAFDNYLAKNPGMEKEAGQEAARVIRRTQAMFEVKDLAEYYRSNEFMKALTMFTNELNNNWNYYRFDMAGKFGAKKIGLGTLARRTFEAFIIPALIIGWTIRSRPQKNAEEFRKDMGSQALSTLPIFGTFFGNVLQGYQSDLNLITFAGIDKALQMMAQANQGDWLAALKTSPELAGLLTGLPTIQTKRFIQGALDLSSGKSDDWMKLIWGRYTRDQYIEADQKASAGALDELSGMLYGGLFDSLDKEKQAIVLSLLQENK